MESMVRCVAHYAALWVELFAIAVIAAGAIEALFGIVRVPLRPGTSNDERRAVWLTFARWLVAGLTFQLAADLVNT